MSNATTNPTAVPAIFSYQDKRVSVVPDEHGEPLFHANELCALLGYSNPWDAVRRHVDEDDLVKREVIDSLGRKQMANWVREPGMWALVLGSETKDAKRVKRWVTHEVLPAIRKTGRYEAGGRRQGLTPEQQRDVQRAVRNKVAMTDTGRYGYITIYDAIKDRFGVGTYKDVPSERFDELLDFVKKLQIQVGPPPDKRRRERLPPWGEEELLELFQGRDAAMKTERELRDRVEMLSSCLVGLCMLIRTCDAPMTGELADKAHLIMSVLLDEYEEAKKALGSTIHRQR